MSLNTDEEEHSIEMHLPYVRKVFEGYARPSHRVLVLILCRQDIQVVPVLVGSIDKASEQKYGKILAPYLAAPDTFFVVSSDFCHWFLMHSGRLAGS
jgi:predicted class III extradiol MEMO1 family dioxygenase